MNKIQETEHRLVKEINPKVVLTITTDKFHRIVSIRNPYRIVHRFRLSHIFNKHMIENWCVVNGFEYEGSRNVSRRMKPNELIKDMIKYPYKYGIRKA